MVKNIIHIEGMSCGMCEAHIADTIRHAFPHAAPRISFPFQERTPLCDRNPCRGSRDQKAIDETGYTYKGMKTEPYEKKGFFSRLLAKHEWFCFWGRHHPLWNKLGACFVFS
mgnify:CR=1 FL=1